MGNVRRMVAAEAGCRRPGQRSTVEDVITMHSQDREGRLVTRDQEGLRQARRPQAVLKAVVQVLERTPELPQRLLSPKGVDEVANPFS